MNFRRPRTRSRRNSLNFIVNSEKWRNQGKRISRRDDDFLEEDSEDDIAQAGELKDWVEEFYVRKSVCVDKSDQDVEVKLNKKQTLILSTLVPDEILLIDKFSSEDSTRFVGVLLMADVSGYTALSEKYNTYGKGGTYRLTVTLNTYLGSLIEIIYSHGGDVIKFAGDAFLALWKTDKSTFINHTIHTAIACALIIQHSFGSYETDVKVNLKVKLAISAGNLIFSPIGTGIDMNYVIFGLPVLEAKAAESACASGEVKLTPSAWGHCYSRNYDHIVDANGYVTIKAILYDPHEKDVTKPFLGFGPLIRQIKKPFISIESLPEFLYISPNELSAADISKRNEILSLRKAILQAEEKDIGSEIRKFMIRPILTQIDAHQPLEYLTEMRQVSILFITLKPRECPFSQLITIINNSYQITCEIVYKSMGCVNKIILFDKDVMILVIFGLRGFKHESEAQAALKCAYSIKKSVSALDGVLEVSIGVTTGQVYCGVVGHPLRREFTVIGAVVNKAARFICGFRNKITCDEATYVKSKMSSNGFTLQPSIALKGINTPGKIYEYTEEIRVKELFEIPIIAPLLNRIDEMEYFQNWIKDYDLPFRDFDALLLIGEPRLGKTRLLEWMARYAKSKQFKVCYLTLTSVHSATQYLAVSQIIDLLLDIKHPVKGFEKEERIVKLLKYYTDDFCYLNNILKLRFAYHEGVSLQNDEMQNEKAKEIFKKLLLSIAEPCVIFIDDLQNLDPLSWEFLSLFFSCMKIFVVFTVTRGKFSTIHRWLYSVFISGNIRKIVLGPLNSTWIAPLACQILDVDAVPNDLCNALRIKCNGMPGLIESFIIHLFSSGSLEIKSIKDLGEWKEEDLQFPDTSLLNPIALDDTNQSALDQLIQDSTTGDIKICIVSKKEELKTDINVQNMDVLIMIQIDSLTPYQQLLLKIASVIGNVISRDLLENIMYENDPITTAKAVKRLFAMRIFTCGNAKHKYNRKTTSSLTIASDISLRGDLTCECYFEFDSENIDKLPKYAFCKVMKFRNKNSRKTCYELLPLNQKKEFHSRVVNYLESHKHKCSDCGGTIIIVQSMTSLYNDLNYDDYHKIREKEIQNVSSSDEEDYEIGSTQNTSKHSASHSILPELAQNSSLNNQPKGTTSEILSKRESIHSQTRHSNSAQFTSILKTTKSVDDSIKRKSIKRVTMSNLVFRDISIDTIKSYAVFDMFRAVMEANKISDWEDLRIIDEKDNDKNNDKESYKLNIEKGVSKTDFDKCTCSDLNIIIYEQLIHHATEAGLKCKVLEFLIRYSELNILANNFENAIPQLERAEQILLADKSIDNLSKFERKKFMGKIYTLQAASYLMSNKLMASKNHIEKAAKIYNINLRKLSDLTDFRYIYNYIKSKRHKYRLQDFCLKSDSIFCLNVATMLFSTLEDLKTARVAALRALFLVQKVDCNNIDLCDALTNAIQIELDNGKPDLTENIEAIAITTLKNRSTPIQADELFALGKMFMATFRARIARAKLPAGIRSGFRALVISRFLHADKISLDIIPDLFYILLCRSRIEEAVDVMKLLLELSQTHNSLECETWYYALAIDMILDCGFQIESPQEISRFAEYAISVGKSAGISRRRLVVGIWTYWLRVDVERKAKLFENEALNWCGNEDDDGSLKTLLSALRLAEGMLESLAKKVDDLKKVVDLMELRSLADKELMRLEQDTKVLKAIGPRWLLLKANSLNLSARCNAAKATFIQALDEARKINNRLEESMITAALANSQLWIQSGKTGTFLDWRTGANNARSSWHQIMYKINNNTR
ncbi:adenylate cyclase type 10-like isoform X1 [Pieris rapae]|uniref:adenylate cyclase type 10-like isoform X1 n=1 Tax=Pieris rapae TaxID=64459 RepID=UPI001E27A999|nr:adenylate cyclase type 10-like isoform X1 [Pieris rapae]